MRCAVCMLLICAGLRGSAGGEDSLLPLTVVPPEESGLTHQVEIRSTDGLAIDIPAVYFPTLATLTEPGSYTWRAVSAWAGPSEWWPFEVVSTVHAEDGDALPTTVELHPNYPNPFNPSTVVRFGLPEPSDVTLEVFDVLGRRVMRVLSRTPYPAGYHRVTLRPDGLASGVYLYRLRAGAVTRTGKMVLLR